MNNVKSSPCSRRTNPARPPASPGSWPTPTSTSGASPWPAAALTGHETPGRRARAGLQGPQARGVRGDPDGRHRRGNAGQTGRAARRGRLPVERTMSMSKTPPVSSPITAPSWWSKSRMWPAPARSRKAGPARAEPAGNAVDIGRLKAAAIPFPHFDGGGDCSATWPGRSAQ